MDLKDFKMMDFDELEELPENEETVSFHSSVRENIIFVLLFLVLVVGSYTFIEKFRRRDDKDLYSTEDDELKVYRISLLFCVFSFAIAIGSSVLLPISIVSNEILLLYPNSYYVQWLNSSLIQGLWNFVFLFSNVAIFLLLPFAYLFSESTGFLGYKKGIIPRLYETFLVFMLLTFIVIGIVFVIVSTISEETNSFLSLLDFTKYLPLLYSCVSFLGVLMLLVCTPIGFVKLFGLLNSVLVKPNILLRDIKEECQACSFEEASVLRKISKENHKYFQFFKDDTSKASSPSKLCSNTLDELSFSKLTNGIPMDEKSLLEIHFTITAGRQYLLNNIFANSTPKEKADLQGKLRHVEAEKAKLEKQKNSSNLSKNLFYPLAMLLLLSLTVITVLLVIQNTIELLIGIKALPHSSRQFALGISSLSKLGVFGAAIEIFVIVYLALTSAVGFYTMPIFAKILPKRRKTSLIHLIANSLLLLILTSALPVLSKILGISNFDLLGEYGSIQWLGNFVIVLLYNLVFVVSTVLCFIKKFSATVRQELVARMVENYFLFTDYMSFIS